MQAELWLTLLLIGEFQIDPSDLPVGAHEVAYLRWSHTWRQTREVDEARLLRLLAGDEGTW